MMKMVKKKILVVSMLLSMLSTNAFALGKEITVVVRGMVCAFCAQGIEKKFNAESAVEKVKVSLKDKQVKLVLKDGKDLSDDSIKKILTDSGYNVDRLDRK